MDDQLISLINKQFPQKIQKVETLADNKLSLTIDREDLLEIVKFLKSSPLLNFNYLSCLSGVDYKENFQVVYHLFSLSNLHYLVLKINLKKDDPQLPTLEGVFPAANWQEREVYDLLGINFLKHPDLRRILLPDDWEGYPLRKDYKEKQHSENVKL